MLILLFYYTGFRFGLVKASNKPNTGIGLLSLDTERIKFLDSKVVQFAFRGKSMFPTNIRSFLSQLVYDNLKEFYTKAVQNEQKYLFSNLQIK